MRVVLALLVVAACGGPPSPAAVSTSTPAPAAAAHEPLATIERTACHGFCPIYKVTVFRDGAVDYEGTRFVKTKGSAQGKLAPEQLAALDQLFQSNHYLGLHDAYEEYKVTDMPSIHTSYVPAGGKAKTVRHYVGDRSAPSELTAVEQGIDWIVDIEHWIGSDEERRALPRD
jgi:hypothetical protein